MSEDAIDAMEAFDREQSNNNRRFYSHEEPFSLQIEGMDTEPDRQPLLQKRHGGALCVEARITNPERRYAWIDELDSESLVKAVEGLKPADLELLTRFAIEGYTVTEIAEQMGVTHQTVSEKIGRLKKYLKKS